MNFSAVHFPEAATVYRWDMHAPALNSTRTRDDIAPDIRTMLRFPFPEDALTRHATSCATPEIRLTGATHPINATHELLLEYARTRATTAPSGTIHQFTEWWESKTGYLIPERTFQRHTSVLRMMGLVDVLYGRDKESPLVKRTWYNLIGVGLVMPSMTVADGVIGFAAPRDRVEEEHQRTMTSLADFDLDALHESWLVTVSDAA